MDANTLKSPVVIQNKNSFMTKNKLDLHQNDKNSKIYEKKGLFSTS